jgi:hypothetical protein
MPYHDVLLPNMGVPIRHQDVLKWLSQQHRVRRQIRGGHVLYKQSKYQHAEIMVSKLIV